MIARYDNIRDAVSFVLNHSAVECVVIKSVTDAYWVVNLGAAKWLKKEVGFEVVYA